MLCVCLTLGSCSGGAEQCSTESGVVSTHEEELSCNAATDEMLKTAASVGRVVAGKNLGMIVSGAGSTAVTRSLEVLEQRVQSFLPHLQAVYEHERQKQPNLMGSVDAYLTIEPNGNVSDLRFLGDCMGKASRSHVWYFSMETCCDEDCSRCGPVVFSSDFAAIVEVADPFADPNVARHDEGGRRIVHYRHTREDDPDSAVCGIPDESAGAEEASTFSHRRLRVVSDQALNCAARRTADVCRLGRTAQAGHTGQSCRDRFRDLARSPLGFQPSAWLPTPCGRPASRRAAIIIQIQ